MRFFKALLTAAMFMLLLSFNTTARIPFNENPKIEGLLSLAGNDFEVRELNWMVPGARIVFDASLYALSNPKERLDYWMVCDIFAVTDDGFVGLLITNSLLEGGKPIIREGYGATFERKQASLFWFNPDILSVLADLPGDVVSSSGKKLIAGSWQSTYTMQTIGASGYINETSYSSETGMLLSDEFVSVDESSAQFIHNGLNYKGYRQAFTGLEDYPQTAIRKGTKLYYTVSTELGGAPLDIPAIRIVMSAEEVGNDWVLYSMETYEDGMPADLKTIAESYRFFDNSCSYYPPEWLMSLTPGTVLCDDDLIGSTVVVEGILDTPQGKRLVTRGVEGITETIDEYDIATGFMVKSTTSLKDLGLTLIEELTEVRHEENQ